MRSSCATVTTLDGCAIGKLLDARPDALRAGRRGAGGGRLGRARSRRRGAEPFDPAHDAACEIIRERASQDLLLRRLREHLRLVERVVACDDQRLALNELLFSDLKRE